MRLIDADKLYPDCVTKYETFAISQGQIAAAKTIEIPKALATVDENGNIKIESIRPQSEWISCKDRLPTSGRYLVTAELPAGLRVIDILSFHTDLYKIDEYDFEQYEGKKHPGWYYIDDEYGYVEADNVVAWMELPKPYEEI